jgi:glyoxylase-like metal-dependent hydrolase (beta-lactamase superfamily II)
MKRALWALLICAASGPVGPSPVHAHEALSLPELMKAVGWDFATTEFRVETLESGLHVLFGVGGNVAVSIGDDGVLIVDDQFPEMVPKIHAAIKGLGGGAVDFAINTHWHFDHAEGNLALGPAGTWLVSQANSREMMRAPHLLNVVTLAYQQDAYPDDALPVITYDDTMQFHFNDEVIDLKHFGPAHTSGDTAVIFRKHNAVHLGDVYDRSGYPFIDVDNGGDLDGMIAFCKAVLADIDKDTVVIPGHGPVARYADLSDYIAMLTTTRERIAKLIDAGATLDEVIAAKPTTDYDAKVGDPASYVNRAFTSLTRARKP